MIAIYTTRIEENIEVSISHSFFYSYQFESPTFYVKLILILQI